MFREVFEKLGSAAIIILANNFFVTLLNFAIMLILLYNLGISQYGVYILLISIIGFGEQLSTLGIFPLVVTELSRERGKKNFPGLKTLLYRFVQLQAVIGVLIAGGILGFSFMSSSLYGYEISSAMVVFALYLIIFPLKNVYNVVFESFLKFQYMAGFMSIELFLRLILLLLAFPFFGVNLFIISIVFLLSLIISLLLAGFFFVKLTSFLLKIEREKANVFFNLVKSTFVYGFITHQIKNTYINFYPWLINFFLSVEAVAIFGILLRVLGIVTRILEPIETALLPVIVGLQHSEEERSRLFSRLTKYSLALGLALMVFSWLGIPFIGLIIGKEFAGNEIAFLFITLELPIVALNMTIKAVLFKEQEQKFITKTISAALLVSFTLGAIMMPYLALVGAALGYVIFPFVDYIIKRAFLQKKYGLSFNYAVLFSIDEVDKKLISELKQLAKTFPRKIARRFK